MFDFTEVQIEKLVIHKVGNKMRDEDYIISQNECKELSLNLRDLLLKYFLTPFKSDIFYHFHHESDINLNEMYHYAQKILYDKNNFYHHSVNILKHLYNVSTHPRIKSGELYVVYLKNFMVNNQMTDAIGLFKSENKDTYLKITENNKDIQVGFEYGININNLDKGCLIFNMQEDVGYLVSIVDTASSGEAHYWKNEFLALSLINDQHLQTKTFIKIVNDFSDKYLSDDKQEAVTLKQRSLNYFVENKSFDLNDFSNNVFGDEEIINNFMVYKQNRSEKLGINTESSFPISNTIVAQIKKNFRNIISLDSRFDIVIKNEINNDFSEYIEKGFDNSKGLPFYKIYFTHEK